jgi:hypothetical protein
MIRKLPIKRGYPRKRNLPVTLRTYKDEIKYTAAKLNGELIPLHKEPRLREWKHWAIIDNAFPYSAVFKTHHLLLPKRVTTEDGLTAAERKELPLILKELNNEGAYDCMMSNFTKKQSILQHYHMHLLSFKEKRFELGR